MHACVCVYEVTVEVLTGCIKMASGGDVTPFGAVDIDRRFGRLTVSITGVNLIPTRRPEM